MCPTLTDPQNGVITLSVENDGSVMATYSCNTGYALTGGDTLRTCTAGVWDGLIPTCEGIYKFPSVHHSQITHMSSQPPRVPPFLCLKTE